MAKARFKVIFILLGILFLSVLVRLFEWQILKSEKLKSAADLQHYSTLVIPSLRGKIFSKDNLMLAVNQESYLLYAEISKLKKSDYEIASKIAPLLVSEDPFLDMSVEEATKSGMKVAKPKKDRIKETELMLEDRLKNKQLFWVMLYPAISKATKNKIENLKISGIGFEPIEQRYYTEASTSAHVLGFVGKDKAGNEKGYFGVEGYYDRELTGRDGMLIQEKDALGRPILFGGYIREQAIDGSDLYLTIDQGLQAILETNLTEGVKAYEAKGGLIIVMDPNSGAIIGIYSTPTYDLRYWQKYESTLYKNPIVADSFEPGSVMKPLIVAAALNENKVKPTTRCTKCAGPRYIGGYYIETYDKKYRPNLTMTEVLINSDNTGMTFISEILGKEKTYKYLSEYGFGALTGVDLQEEEVGNLRDLIEWRVIDLATVSFGQGIAVTPIQLVSAFASLANGGVLYKPYVVERIEDKGKVIKTSMEKKKQVIKSSTSKVITEMLVETAEKSPLGYARLPYKILDDFRIAAKCGTAQIPIGGKYSQNRTIGSAIGYFPADAPKYLVLVTLFEPKADPWGANTAGPIFFRTVSDLVTYFGVSP